MGLSGIKIEHGNISKLQNGSLYFDRVDVLETR